MRIPRYLISFLDSIIIYYILVVLLEMKLAWKNYCTNLIRKETHSLIFITGLTKTLLTLNRHGNIVGGAQINITRYTKIDLLRTKPSKFRFISYFGTFSFTSILELYLILRSKLAWHFRLHFSRTAPQMRRNDLVTGPSSSSRHFMWMSAGLIRASKCLNRVNHRINLD